MSDPVQERLLGYVLGALDDAERQQVDEALQNDPQLRRELSRAKQSLKLLEGTRADYAPPPGLALRTCRLVAEHPRPLHRRALTPVPVASLWTDGTRWPDLAMTAAVLFVAGLLIAPAVQHTRYQAQITACKDNLRDLGMSLVDYSHMHQGYFPEVPREGKLSAAGIFAPSLLGVGVL